MATPSVTIFTPTFNREHTIKRLYDSLLNQTSFDFEWIVINDGSADNTDGLFSNILKEVKPFQIFYQKKENGGKHRAINDAVKIARGRLFFIVDSDDYLTENAIEKILSYEKTLDTSHKWAGISGLRGHTPTDVIGQGPKTKNYIDAKNNERDKVNLLGDKAEVYFTELLKQYPFPEFEGEKFITESTVWDAIARDGYYIRWFNDIIYICNYLDDGLTKHIIEHHKKSPQGVLYWRKIQLEAYPNDPEVWKNTLIFYYDLRKGSVGRCQIARELNINPFVLFFFLLAVKLGIR